METGKFKYAGVAVLVVLLVILARFRPGDEVKPSATEPAAAPAATGDAGAALPPVRDYGAAAQSFDVAGEEQLLGALWPRLAVGARASRSLSQTYPALPVREEISRMASTYEVASAYVDRRIRDRYPTSTPASYVPPGELAAPQPEAGQRAALVQLLALSQALAGLEPKISDSNVSTEVKMLVQDLASKLTAQIRTISTAYENSLPPGEPPIPPEKEDDAPEPQPLWRSRFWER